MRRIFRSRLTYLPHTVEVDDLCDPDDGGRHDGPLSCELHSPYLSDARRAVKVGEHGDPRRRRAAPGPVGRTAARSGRTRCLQSGRGSEHALPRPDRRHLRRPARLCRARAGRRQRRRDRRQPRARHSSRWSRRSSQDRPKYAEHAALHAEAVTAARALADRFLALADEDAAAYGALRRGDEAPTRHGVRERQKRDAAISQAARGASDVAVSDRPGLRARSSGSPRRSPAAATATPLRPRGRGAARVAAVARGRGERARQPARRSATTGRPASCSSARRTLADEIERLAAIAQARPSASGESREPLRGPPRVTPASGEGPRLLRGAPIAAEIREQRRRTTSPRSAARARLHARPSPCSSSGATRRRPSTSTRSSTAARRSASRAAWSRSRAARSSHGASAPRSSASTRTRTSPGSSSRCRCPQRIPLRTVIDTLDPREGHRRHPSRATPAS